MGPDMADLGRFLELSVPTPDIQTSLDFYRTLGFAELDVGEIRTHYYGVVTDGRIAIGLHSGHFNEPALSFIHNGLAQEARTLADHGTDFVFQHLGDDEFNEVGLYSPDRHLLALLEAPTFAQAQANADCLPLTGHIREISLRCTDEKRSVTFWENAGCIADEDTGDASIALYATGIKLGLRKDLPSAEPVLRFGPKNPDALLEDLDQQNIGMRPTVSGHLITAPEGTRLLIAGESGI